MGDGWLFALWSSLLIDPHETGIKEDFWPSKKTDAPCREYLYEHVCGASMAWHFALKKKKDQRMIQSVITEKPTGPFFRIERQQKYTP